MLYPIIIIIIIITIIILIVVYLGRLQLKSLTQVQTTASTTITTPTTLKIIRTTTGALLMVPVMNNYDDNNQFNMGNSLCHNCQYVNQSQMIYTSKKLYTTHVGTCNVLVFSMGNNNFMAHIDSQQNTEEELKDFLEKNIPKEELKNINPVVIKGPWCEKQCTSFTKITNVLDSLKIKYQIFKGELSFENEVLFDKNIITIK